MLAEHSSSIFFLAPPDQRILIRALFFFASKKKRGWSIITLRILLKEFILNSTVDLILEFDTWPIPPKNSENFSIKTLSISYIFSCTLACTFNPVWYLEFLKSRITKELYLPPLPPPPKSPVINQGSKKKGGGQWASPCSLPSLLIIVEYFLTPFTLRFTFFKKLILG